MHQHLIILYLNFKNLPLSILLPLLEHRCPNVLENGSQVQEIHSMIHLPTKCGLEDSGVLLETKTVPHVHTLTQIQGRKRL